MSVAGGGLKEGARVVSQRDLRSLGNLNQTSSTSRVLNLNAVHRESGREREYQLKPFFRHSQMNRAILIKHTLRADERHLFSLQKRTATKILLPFDVNDLRLGGQSVLVGQIGYDGFLRAFYDTENTSSLRDVDILRAVDSLPSLDPFLVREYLGRHGFKPGQCYLKISPGDILKMLAFCNGEMESLVKRAVGVEIKGGSVSLAGKILSSDMTSDLDPLRRTLRMDEEDFSEGLFAWRGFLYFKWRWTELQKELKVVLESLADYQPRGAMDQDHLVFLNTVRPRIGHKVFRAIKQTGRTLVTYDIAYSSLVTAVSGCEEVRINGVVDALDVS